MSKKGNIKNSIFRVIDDHRSHNILNRAFHGILFALILISSLILVIETVKDVYRTYHTLFFVLEITTMVFFSVEYILRIYTCTEVRGYSHPITGRLKYVFTPLMLIDILSIVPFYMILFSSHYTGFYIFGIFRVLRLLKAIRYVNAFSVIGKVFYFKREQLLISMVFILFVFVFASSIIYIAEKDAQPEKFKNVPAAMWYTIATITTVGYGDIYPITGIGKVTGGLISVIGLILFAIPASILTSGFLKINELKRKHKCPHCGNRLE